MFPYLQWPIYSAWTWSTPIIPNFYWNAYSMEQRFKNLCLNQGKVAAYLDEVAEDTNEWAEDIADTFTTQYNNFTEEINDRVEEVESLVTDSRKYIGIIGDSWSAYSETNDKWTFDFAEITGYTLINKANNGAGFTCGPYSSTKRFYQQMQELINDERWDMIDYIIVYGGINDWNHGPNWDGTPATPSEMVQGFINILNVYLNNSSTTKSPKLIFVFGNVGLQKKNRYIGYEAWYQSCINALRAHINSAGLDVCIVDFVPWWLTFLSSPTSYFNDDEIHPTALGYKIISNFMLQIVNGVYTGVHRSYTFDSSIFTNNFTPGTVPSGLVYSFDNGITSIIADINGSATMPANSSFLSIAQIPNNISPMLTPYNHGQGNEVSWIYSTLDSQSFQKIENNHLYMYNYMFNANNGMLYLHSLDHNAAENTINYLPDAVCIGKITNG